MRFFTTLAVGVLSFSASIAAIDYPTVADLVSREKEYVGPNIQVFGQAAATLNVTGWDWANAGSPWAMINHDASAFARAVHYSFLPQWAVTAPKINTSADASALLDGWRNITESCACAWDGFIRASLNFPTNTPVYDRPNDTIVTLAGVPGEVQIYLIPILSKFPGIQRAINASFQGIADGANEALRVWRSPTITVADITQ